MNIGLIISQKILNKNLAKKRGKILVEDDITVLKTLKKLKAELDYVHKNFDEVVDSDLIDGYIYEMQAINMKYKYYLGLCKERGLIGNDISVEWRC